MLPWRNVGALPGLEAWDMKPVPGPCFHVLALPCPWGHPTVSVGRDWSQTTRGCVMFWAKSAPGAIWGGQDVISDYNRNCCRAVMAKPTQCFCSVTRPGCVQRPCFRRCLSLALFSHTQKGLKITGWAAGCEVVVWSWSFKLRQVRKTSAGRCNLAVPGTGRHVSWHSFSVLPPSDCWGRRPKTSLGLSARLSLSLSLLQPPLPAARTGCVLWQSGHRRSLHYALLCWELVHKPLTESDTTQFYSKNNGKREKCSCKDPCQPRAVLVWVALSSPRLELCLLAPAPHHTALPPCLLLACLS